MKIGIIRASGALLLSLSLLIVAGCGGGGGLYGGGGGGGGSPPTGTITMITLSPATMTVAVNGTQQYTTVAKDSNGNVVNGANFTWTSSNPSVATVNSSGLATGVAAGTAMITASITYTGGIYGMGITYTSNAATLTVSANGMAVGEVAVGASSMQSGMGGMMGMNTMSGMNMMPITHSVQGAMVSLKDSQNQTVVAMTDGNGRYQFSTSGLSAPFLLKAQDNQGHVLFSFADQSGVINITPLTDLMVRMWYGARGVTPEAAFANPGAHPGPQVAELALLNKTVTGLLSESLSRAGLDPAKFDLITTPFTADGTGFDQVLNNTSISTANGQVLVRDSLSNNQTVIAFDQPHTAVELTLVSHASTHAVTNSTVVLR